METTPSGTVIDTVINPYLPIPTTITEIIMETAARDIKTFKLGFRNESDAEKFDYTCGQFAEISIFGAGECPIGIASSPMDKGSLQFTVKKAGHVTKAFHSCEEGMDREPFFKEFRGILKHKNFMAYIISFMFYQSFKI